MTKHHKKLLMKLHLLLGLIGPASGIYPLMTGLIPVPTLQRLFKSIWHDICVQVKRRKLTNNTLGFVTEGITMSSVACMHRSTPYFRAMDVPTRLLLVQQNPEVFASGNFVVSNYVDHEALELYGLKSARTEDLVAKSGRDYLFPTARHHFGYYSEFHVRSCFPFLDSPGQATLASQP
jgi:hypothetical protein